MRILKVTQAYYPFLEKGGPAVKVRAIAERLAERGHQVTVLTADHGSSRETRLERIGEVEVVYLRSLLAYRSTTLNPGLVSFCRRRLREFDLAHIYGLYDLLGPTVAFFCRMRKVPYLVEPMGMYRPIVRSLHKKRLYHRVVGSAMVEGASSLIATSAQERRELIEEGVPAGKIVVRRNGLDASEFAHLPARGAFRCELRLANGQPLILYLGRLSKKKGLDLLLRAFATLPVPAQLAIVGPDDHDGCWEEIERLRTELNLQNRVWLAGPRFGLKKLEALVDADVFVLASQNENFGNAVAEAVACGTPVVVTDRCGIAPLVGERAGLVVPYDAEALRASLTRLLEDDGLRKRLRAGCQPTAQALSWDQPLFEMEALYETVVAEARAG